MAHGSALTKMAASVAIGILSTAFLSSCINDTTSEAPAEIPHAQNVIIFIADGMGVSTITAARIFDGQSEGRPGEEHVLAFEEFENLALIKTYNTNAQVPDSAGTATAILSGYKTNIWTINIPPDIMNARSLQACEPDALPPTLTDIAKKAGKSVGVVSTARITHATPAAMFGHAPYRSFEADTDMVEPFEACPSLAQQLVESDVDIVLGGGSREFTDVQIDSWRARNGHIYVKDGPALMASDKSKAVLGLFSADHMSYEADRAGTDEPSLAEMTNYAIEALSTRDTDGYVLMVEAGRIDHAHHATNAYRALRDVQALNEAVKVAKARTGNDTLILVTADHSHVFTMAGYPARGNPILGLVRSVDGKTGQPSTELSLAKDGKPYTTLGYQNGGNIRLPDSPALTDDMVQSPDFLQQVAVPLGPGGETHAGEDVPLYATGPGSENVRGVMEQNKIHDVMIKAMGLE